VRTDGAWYTNGARDQPFTKVLVVGVSPDLNQRCAFERFLATQIRSQATATKAIPSCDAMSHDDPLTRENIERAVAERQADAVFATILVAAEIGMKEDGSSETRGDAYFKATEYGYMPGYYGVYGVPVVYVEFETAPPVTMVEGQMQIVTKVYETAGATLIYELNTRARHLESRVSALAELTGPMAERLRRDGLIR